MKNRNKFLGKKIRQKCLSPNKKIRENLCEYQKKNLISTKACLTLQKYFLPIQAKIILIIPNIINPMAPLQPKNKTLRSQFKVDRNNIDMIYLQIYEWKHLHIFDES